MQGTFKELFEESEIPALVRRMELVPQLRDCST